MRKLKEEKVFRDPIAGYIRVDDAVVWDCINAREFQRLRRIRQLGTTSAVFHGGEHSRFGHSLGVYEITRRMVSEVGDIANGLSEHEKLVVKLAGLLHDLGHAPFSHSFERVLRCNHEVYTVQIIRGDSEIHDVLYREDPDLPEEVASIIDGTHPNAVMKQMINSQLDADRMDYLLRDSYFTGTSYGQYDLERVLRTLRVADDRLTIKESGVHTIEDYIMARYHMYWQVYYHPVSRSFDSMLNLLFERLVDVYKQDKSIAERLPMFKDLLENEHLSNQQFHLLDDNVCYYAFQLLEKEVDPILSDLADRLLQRRLFGYCEPEKAFEIEKRLLEKGFDPKYYLCSDIAEQVPYQPYDGRKDHSIWILSRKQGIVELSQYSRVVKALCFDYENVDSRIFYPKEVETDD